MQFWKKNFFLRFGKKITRVHVVKHRNNIKIKIVHQTINMARQVFGQNFSLLRRTVWLLRHGQTDGRPDRIPEFNTSLIGRGKNNKL
jgi:hypothetical protein